MPLTTLTIPQGQLSITQDVQILDDSLNEGNETFDLVLSNPVGATLGDATGRGTIVDDDTPPQLSIDDVEVEEGPGGPTATFTISLSEAIGSTVTVEAATSDGTATAGDDYGASGPTQLTITAGQTSTSFGVTIFDDSLEEGNETFNVTLSNPSANAILGDANGVGTILDDEATTCGAPSIDFSSDREAFLWRDCSSGDWSMLFTAGGQYSEYEGTVTSDLGFTSVTPVSVESNDVLNVGPTTIQYELFMGQIYSDGFDFGYQPGANVCVGVDMPAGTMVLVGAARTPTVVPFDPDTLGACSSGPPVVSVNDVTVGEAAGTATFTVSLSEVLGSQVTVDFETQDDTATDGADYTGTPPTQISIPAGQTSVSQGVPILDDSLVEGDETFRVVLSNVSANASLGDATGIGTIRDDEVSACGEPPIDLTTDREAFLWRDCSSGEWFMRFTAGGLFTIYEGGVNSSAGYSSVVPFSVESNDTLDVNGNDITYRLQMGQVYWDGFDFTTPGGADVCVDVDSPAGITVLVGELRTPVAVPFDPETLGPCT